MRSKNTMGKLEYVWENLYWAFLFFLLYRNLLFIPLFGFDYRQSLLLLASSVIFGMSIGILLTHKYRRNHVSLICNILLSYGVYYSVSLWFINSRLINSFLLAAVFSVAGYAMLVIITYIIDRTKSNLDVSIWKCLSSCLLNCRTLLAYVLAISILYTAIKPLFGFPVLERQEEIVLLDTTEDTTEGETISKNMDIVLLLQEEKWTHLDATERLDVMKTIADIEANYLGIPKVSICAAVLGENTMGYYTDSTRTITLNLSYLANADAHTILTTVCHECYHAYQHRLVELYNELDSEDQGLILFYETAQYRDEFTNYTDGSNNYYAYCNQRCEIDSEEYAEDAVIDYYCRIDQYIDEHKDREENE